MVEMINTVLIVDHGQYLEAESQPQESPHFELEVIIPKSGGLVGYDVTTKRGL